MEKDKGQLVDFAAYRAQKAELRADDVAPCALAITLYSAGATSVLVDGVAVHDTTIEELRRAARTAEVAANQLHRLLLQRDPQHPEAVYYSLMLSRAGARYYTHINESIVGKRWLVQAMRSLADHFDPPPPSKPSLFSALGSALTAFWPRKRD